MEKASSLLNEGKIYTRENLEVLFNTKDKTLYTGVFQPKDSLGKPMMSILLFISEKGEHLDSSYINFISGNNLIWTSQRKVGTDKKIIEHEIKGIELLVFFRKDKYKYKNSGFKYLGQYRYIFHKKQTNDPSIFYFERVDPWDLKYEGLIVPKDEIQKIFSRKGIPNSNIDDFLETEAGFIIRKYRPAQTKFSNDVKKLDHFACVVSGNNYQGNLEAGHIKDVRFEGPFTIRNGLTFTRNIHAAFDRGDVVINPKNYMFELNFQNFPKFSEIPQYAGTIISAAERIDPSYLEFKYEMGKAEVQNVKIKPQMNSPP